MPKASACPPKAELLALYTKHGGVIVKMADALGVERTTMSNWCRNHRLKGKGRGKPATLKPSRADLLKLHRQHRGHASAAARALGVSHGAVWAWWDQEGLTSTGHDNRRNKIPARDLLVTELRRSGGTLLELSAAIGESPKTVRTLLAELRNDSVVVDQRGERYSIGKSLAPAFTEQRIIEYVSRPDNTFVFGALGDSHLGSKYERLDVTNDLYDRYEAVGVDRVFHTGNWIDGDEPKNRHDIGVHGMEPQLQYLADYYPQRDGLVTYAVTGEDHEGWWTRSEGIDIGRRAEQTMRENGRTDWFNLGFMEAHVRLVNANTGKSAIMAVVHPGGGSSYALSYSIQKIIEALEGGEKPAVGLYGHYHKLWAGNIRNVWVVCTGCGQDQTIFTRNKVKQEMHVGGSLIELEQDPSTGAIISMMPQLIRYFVKGYYNGRWHRAHGVTKPARAAW